MAKVEDLVVNKNKIEKFSQSKKLKTVRFTENEQNDWSTSFQFKQHFWNLIDRSLPQKFFK